MRRLVLLAAALAASLAVSLTVGSAGAAPTALTKTPTAVGTGGAAATVDVLATEAALDVLRAGGNAVDAAVAAAAVLGVTEPYSCGIGGGGFMVLYRASDGLVTTIDHRERAPFAMHPESFMENGAPLPFAAARYSGLSVGVPGTVAGWADALAKYGTISLAEALQPAIQVAREGFEVDATFVEQTNQNLDFFNDIPATAEVFLEEDGTAYDVGETFRNPDLARTYERIAHLGAKAFYRGEVAEAMVETVQAPPVAPDANHVWRPGVMKMRDLHTYVAPEREPTHVEYRGLDVYGMGPPSSGGSTVGEALNILEGYDLGGMSRAEAFHYFIEASRYSFADRNTYLGDSDFVDVPLAGLLSDSFAAERRALIRATAANRAVAAGDPWPHQPAAVASATDTEGVSTTHLTVADDDGNVVSYTYTIESTGGAGLVPDGFGFLLNNELTDFNFDSLVHANRVEGGKRPRSSMSPTIVLRDGAPLLALGSPGGSTIITTVLQLLVDRVDLGSSLPEALAAPRATQRNGATTLAEPAFLSSPVGAELRTTYGHRLGLTGEIGAATGIELRPGGSFVAAAEPVRRGGGSAGVVAPE